MMPAGWLPTPAFAKQWLSFVTQPEHPVMSLPWHRLVMADAAGLHETPETSSVMLIVL
jgi:hypothetical protein